MITFSCWRSKLLRPLRQHCRYGYVHVPKKRIPHILGPGYAWRKCFVVHPQTQLLDPLSKYLWLTRSRAVRGLPELDKPLLPDGAVGRFRASCEEALLPARSSPSQQRELLLELLLAALTSLRPFRAMRDHLAWSNLTFDPKLECFWRHRGVNLISWLEPLCLVLAASPLRCFVSPGDLVGDPSPDFDFHPSVLGLFERSFDNITPFGGVKRLAPFSFGHTLFLFDCKSRGRDQLLAHALMGLFCLAAGECVQHGHPVNADLTSPRALQAVLSDGKQFTFVCFQLNTLDLEGERSNVLWLGPSLPLYQCLGLAGKVDGFDEDCAENLLCFLQRSPDSSKDAKSQLSQQS